MPTNLIAHTPVVVRIDVRGIAQPKGSTRAFNIPGLKAPIVTSDNPKLKDWQHAVQRAAALECVLLMHGPVRVYAHFQLPRPKSRKRDRHHMTKPDLDKLIRAVNDALTGTAYKDDSQVVSIVTTKEYCAGDEQPGVHIRLESIE